MRQHGLSPELTRYNLARSRPGAGRSGRMGARLTDSGVEEAAPGPDVGDADHDMIHDGPCLFVRGKHGRPSSRASQGMGRRPGQGTAFRSPASGRGRGASAYRHEAVLRGRARQCVVREHAAPSAHGSMADRQHAPWHGPSHPQGPEITERDCSRSARLNDRGFSSTPTWCPG